MDHPVANQSAGNQPQTGASIRPGLGIVALGSGVIGLWAFLVADDPVLGGLVVRIGIIFAALWVAHPVLASRSRTAWIVTLVGGLVLLLRPRAALFVVPILALWAVTAGRR